MLLPGEASCAGAQLHGFPRLRCVVKDVPQLHEPSFAGGGPHLGARPQLSICEALLGGWGSTTPPSPLPPRAKQWPAPNYKATTVGVSCRAVCVKKCMFQICTNFPLFFVLLVCCDPPPPPSPRGI